MMLNAVTSPRNILRVVIATFCGVAAHAIPEVRADDEKAGPATAKTAIVRSASQVVFLWPSGAATLQGAGEKETTDPVDPQPGERIKSIKNVHNPSIEVHLPPADKAVG